ncbi:MAG: hypothetical protein ACOC6F_02120 [bacterium]
MDTGTYFALGVLVGFLYVGVAVTIFMVATGAGRYKEVTHEEVRPAVPVQVSDLRRTVQNLKQELANLDDGLLSYGTSAQEDLKRWRTACLSFAHKAAITLQSYWTEAQHNRGAWATYAELCQSMASVGMQEVQPVVGERIHQDDPHYRLRVSEGPPPYEVARVVCPGYIFRTQVAGVPHSQAAIVLEPAIVDGRSSR